MNGMSSSRDVVSSVIKDNQTWNECPECGYAWKDTVPTPGLLHRIIKCDVCMKTIRVTKPIALITGSIPYAIQWALKNFKKVEYYSSHDKRIVADGQFYAIVTSIDDLKAWEISDYKDIGDTSKPAVFYSKLIEFARTRIR